MHHWFLQDFAELNFFILISGVTRILGQYLDQETIQHLPDSTVKVKLFFNSSTRKLHGIKLSDSTYADVGMR
jgi:hypothetical protein